jgi:hypothetical protein
MLFVNTEWSVFRIYEELFLQVPYFPVDNARVIYTKKYIKQKNPVVRVIHKVRVMQLKSKKF